MFAEEIFGGEGVEGEVVPPQERSFWAKYVSVHWVNCPNFHMYWIFFFGKRRNFLLLIDCTGMVVSVDVPDPSWAHCHECGYPSNEHGRGTGWCSLSWWASTAASCNPAWVKFFCAEKISCFLILFLNDATSTQVYDIFRFDLWLYF